MSLFHQYWNGMRFPKPRTAEPPITGTEANNMT